MGEARSIGHYHRLFGLKGDVDNHKRLKKAKKLNCCEAGVN